MSELDEGRKGSWKFNVKFVTKMSQRYMAFAALLEFLNSTELFKFLQNSTPQNDPDHKVKNEAFQSVRKEFGVNKYHSIFEDIAEFEAALATKDDPDEDMYFMALFESIATNVMIIDDLFFMAKQRQFGGFPESEMMMPPVNPWKDFSRFDHQEEALLSTSNNVVSIVKSEKLVAEPIVAYPIGIIEALAYDNKWVIHRTSTGKVITVETPGLTIDNINLEGTCYLNRTIEVENAIIELIEKQIGRRYDVAVISESTIDNGDFKFNIEDLRIVSNSLVSCLSNGTFVSVKFLNSFEDYKNIKETDSNVVVCGDWSIHDAVEEFAVLTFYDEAMEYCITLVSDPKCNFTISPVSHSKYIERIKQSLKTDTVQ